MQSDLEKLSRRYAAQYKTIRESANALTAASPPEQTLMLSSTVANEDEKEQNFNEKLTPQPPLNEETITEFIAMIYQLIAKKDTMTRSEQESFIYICDVFETASNGALNDVLLSEKNYKRRGKKLAFLTKLQYDALDLVVELYQSYKEQKNRRLRKETLDEIEECRSQMREWFIDFKIEGNNSLKQMLKASITEKKLTAVSEVTPVEELRKMVDPAIDCRMRIQSAYRFFVVYLKKCSEIIAISNAAEKELLLSSNKGKENEVSFCKDMWRFKICPKEIERHLDDELKFSVDMLERIFDQTLQVSFSLENACKYIGNGEKLRQSLLATSAIKKQAPLKAALSDVDCLVKLFVDLLYNGISDPEKLLLKRHSDFEIDSHNNSKFQESQTESPKINVTLYDIYSGLYLDSSNYKAKVAELERIKIMLFKYIIYREIIYKCDTDIQTKYNEVAYVKALSEQCHDLVSQDAANCDSNKQTAELVQKYQDSLRFWTKNEALTLTEKDFSLLREQIQHDFSRISSIIFLASDDADCILRRYVKCEDDILFDEDAQEKKSDSSSAILISEKQQTTDSNDAKSECKEMLSNKDGNEKISASILSLKISTILKHTNFLILHLQQLLNQILLARKISTDLEVIMQITNIISKTIMMIYAVERFSSFIDSYKENYKQHLQSLFLLIQNMHNLNISPKIIPEAILTSCNDSGLKNLKVITDMHNIYIKNAKITIYILDSLKNTIESYDQTEGVLAEINEATELIIYDIMSFCNKSLAMYLSNYRSNFANSIETISPVIDAAFNYIRNVRDMHFIAAESSLSSNATKIIDVTDLNKKIRYGVLVFQIDAFVFESVRATYSAKNNQYYLKLMQKIITNSKTLFDDKYYEIGDAENIKTVSVEHIRYLKEKSAPFYENYSTNVIVEFFTEKATLFNKLIASVSDANSDLDTATMKSGNYTLRDAFDSDYIALIIKANLL